MWYSVFTSEWIGKDVAVATYAESDNGVDWREAAGAMPPNNLLPAVMVDPTAPASHRYRGVIYLDPRGETKPSGSTHPGYYTLHSADGLRWNPDASVPTWGDGDASSCAWHPWQNRGIVAYKRSPTVRRAARRAVWTAELKDGNYSQGIIALVPDDYDDVCAGARGFVAGDYYGLSMLPATKGIVGFLQQFRMIAPCHVDGATDVSLVYQDTPGDRWLHAPGRRDFLTHGVTEWSRGGIYPAPGVVEVGDEQRLYFTGAPESHGWTHNDPWAVQNRWVQDLRDRRRVACVGVARWPKWRLFGYRANPEGVLTIYLGRITRPSELVLNYEVPAGGKVRVQLETPVETNIFIDDFGGGHCGGKASKKALPGFALDDSIILEGSSLTGKAAWAWRHDHPSERPAFARVCACFDGTGNALGI